MDTKLIYAFNAKQSSTQLGGGGVPILTELMNGRLSREPRTGTLLMNPMATGKKPLEEKTHMSVQK